MANGSYDLQFAIRNAAAGSTEYFPRLADDGMPLRKFTLAMNL